MEDEEELSEDAVLKICFSLWMVETAEKNKEKLADNEILVKQIEEMIKQTKKSMDELTEEQRNHVLEVYKRTNDEFNKEYGYE